MGHLLYCCFLLIAVTVQGNYAYEAVYAGALPRASGHHAAIYDGDDSVFIIGGGNGYLPYYDTVLHYNISSQEVTQVSTFPHDVSSSTIGTDGNGTFYHFGGSSSEDCFRGVISYMGQKNVPSGPKNPNCYLTELDEIYAFTTANPNAELVGELPRTLYYSSAASDGAGNVYLSGGQGPIVPDEIYRFDSATSQVDIAGYYPTTILIAGTTWVTDSVYLFGGSVDGPNDNDRIYKFTPGGDAVALATIFPRELYYPSAVTVGQDVYIVGGWSQSDYETFRFFKFNTVTETLEELSLNLNLGLQTSAVYVAKSNRIYFFGGSLQLWGNDYAEIYYIQL